MRKGFIKISDSSYKNNWDEIFVFMKDFRPIFIEFRYWENDVWYLYGISDKFKELKEGDIVPQYDIVFTQHNDGKVVYEFKLINP